MRDQYDRKLRLLLDADGLEGVLDTMARRLKDLYPDPSGLIVMGMASRGIPLGKRLTKRLSASYGREIPFGSLDASFYRDDFHFRKKFANPSMRIAEVPLSVEAMDIVLVDDVLFTGRSVRAAMEALMDLGRARTIRLCVLADRGHRELPIQPDCVGVQVVTEPGQEVRCYVQPVDKEDSVWLVEVLKS